MNFKSHIKKHYQHQLARGMRHTSIFINVLPVTAVLFTDPRPCCFQPSAGLANSANKCGGSAKQAKCLPGWDQPGNPFPLSPNQDEKRDGAHERPCIRTWSPGCHLLLPAWKEGIVWVWRGEGQLRLDDPIQLLFIHWLVAHLSYSAICAIHSLVYIIMYSALGLIDQIVDFISILYPYICTN